MIFNIYIYIYKFMMLDAQICISFISTGKSKKINVMQQDWDFKF